MVQENTIQSARADFDRDGFAIIRGFYSPQETRSLIEQVERFTLFPRIIAYARSNRGLFFARPRVTLDKLAHQNAYQLDELVRGKVDIGENLGVAPRHFAYPNGLWNEHIEGMVNQVFDSARLFMGVGRAQYITPRTDPYRLSTININHLLPHVDFQRLVDRTDLDYKYYPESRAIKHAGLAAT